MIRVLQMFGEPLSNGGQESFIMNMYRNIDKTKVQFDFYTPYYCDNEILKNEILELGGKLYVGNGKFNEKNNKKELKKNTIKFFKENNNYEIVHIHSGSSYALMELSKIAYKNKVKNIIIHSHCGGTENVKHKIVKMLTTPALLKYPTKYVACSKVAAEWKFPKEIINKNNYNIFNNAIDTSKIYYAQDIRDKTRKKFGIDDNFVIGHIGRFTEQKNHEFLIDIFNEILKKEPNAKLLLIGVGELQEKIRDKVKNLKLDEKVLFLNIRNEINDLLNAMDVFLLPSLYEGLPVVGVEAEATGLKVYTSTEVTRELPIKDLTEYYSLKDSANIWAENIITDFKGFNRRNTTNEIINFDYDVKSAAKKMENFYLNL